MCKSIKLSVRLVFTLNTLYLYHHQFVYMHWQCVATLSIKKYTIFTIIYLTRIAQFLERSNWGERTESKCRKDDHDLWYCLNLLQSSGKFPRAICCTGVGNNSILCDSCKQWVHKKCIGLKHLTKDPDYKCARCQGTAHPLDSRPQREVQIRPDKLEVVASFC